MNNKKIIEEFEKLEIVDTDIDEEHNALVCSCKRQLIIDFWFSKIDQVREETRKESIERILELERKIENMELEALNEPYENT